MILRIPWPLLGGWQLSFSARLLRASAGGGDRTRVGGVETGGGGTSPERTLVSAKVGCAR